MAKPDRIFASELLEREVMDLRAGEIVGAVTDFNVTREGVVTQLGVLPLAWYRGGRGIAPGGITNVTRDRVSIEDSTLLDDFGPDGESSLSAMLGDNIYGKQVLQADGELLGSLADFAFDLSDGRITDIVVFGDDDKRSKITVERIQTIGKSYIVVARTGAAEVQPGPKPAATGEAAEEPRRAEAPAPPVAAADVLEEEEPLGSTGYPDEAAVAQAVPDGPDYGSEDLVEVSLSSVDTAQASAVEAEIAPPPMPEVEEDKEEADELEGGGAAIAAEPMMTAEPVPPIVEEAAPPVAEAPPERPARRTPTGRGRPEPDEDDEGAVGPTGRRSRPRGTPTGRASRVSGEALTGRSSTPRPPRRSEQQLELGAEVEAEPATGESLDNLGLSTFDRRKAEFLLGKEAHRDISGADGTVLLARGTPFTAGRIASLLEQGMLNSVFLEMTQQKGS